MSFLLRFPPNISHFSSRSRLFRRKIQFYLSWQFLLLSIFIIILRMAMGNFQNHDHWWSFRSIWFYGPRESFLRQIAKIFIEAFNRSLKTSTWSVADDLYLTRYNCDTWGDILFAAQRRMLTEIECRIKWNDLFEHSQELVVWCQKLPAEGDLWVAKLPSPARLLDAARYVARSVHVSMFRPLKS